MSHLTFQTTPHERAIIRWTLRARGKGDYNRVFTFPLFPQGLSFVCFDGDRLHRYTWNKKDLPEVPVLGASWEIPDLSGVKGVDVISLTRDDDLPAPVMQFGTVIGKAHNASTAAIISDGSTFRDAVLAISAQTGFGKQKYIIVDLFGGALIYEAMVVPFEVEDPDGMNQAYAVDPKYLKDACPYAPKTKKKSTPLYLAATDKTLMLDNGYQMAVIAQKIWIPDEEQAEEPAEEQAEEQDESSA